MMYVRMSQRRTDSLPKQQALLEEAREWMQDACQKLHRGEHLKSHETTTYRYACMAVLMVSHQKSDKVVSDFKVRFIFFLLFFPSTVCSSYF